MSYVLQRLPQNDEELNEFIASMNRAYGKYFDHFIGSNRSLKLRDCICEGLGFTNGGYQQLKAHWQAMVSYDFTDPKLIMGLCSDRTGGYETIIAKPFAWPVIKHLCTYFPMQDGQFCSGDNLPEGMEFNPDLEFEWYGWELVDMQFQNQLTVAKENKDNGDWFPLYYGQYVVGYSFSREEARLMNGILLSAKMNSALEIEVKPDHDEAQVLWNEYAKTVDQSGVGFAKPARYLELRQSEMAYGVIMPFDELHLSDMDVVVLKGGEQLEMRYDSGNGKLILDGEAPVGFDFVNAYGDDLSVQSGTQDMAGQFYFSYDPQEGFCNVEWFGGSHVQLMPIDGDYDSMIERNYSVGGVADRVY